MSDDTPPADRDDDIVLWHGTSESAAKLLADCLLKALDLAAPEFVPAP